MVSGSKIYTPPPHPYPTTTIAPAAFCCSPLRQPPLDNRCGVVWQTYKPKSLCQNSQLRIRIDYIFLDHVYVIPFIPSICCKAPKFVDKCKEAKSADKTAHGQNCLSFQISPWHILMAMVKITKINLRVATAGVSFEMSKTCRPVLYL